MIKLYSPRNESELVFLKSILDGEGIHYFVRNDHFGSLEVGPRIELLNAKAILVDEGQYNRAKELIADFLIKVEEEKPEGRPKYTLLDKIRMVFEVIRFNWIMPGRRGRGKTED